MAIFRSVHEVEEYTIEKGHEALEEIAMYTFIQWKGLIKKKVYDEGRLKADPSNNFYKRTNQFIDSLELRWINPLLVEIGYNTDKILPSMMVDRNTFNRHTSFSGVDVSDLIPLFIEEGNGNSPIHSYEGLHMYDQVCEMLTRSYHLLLREALSRRGIKTL